MRRWTRDLVDDLAARAHRDHADREAERAQEHEPTPPVDPDGVCWRCGSVCPSTACRCGEFPDEHAS